MTNRGLFFMYHYQSQDLDCYTQEVDIYFQDYTFRNHFYSSIFIFPNLCLCERRKDGEEVIFQFK